MSSLSFQRLADAVLDKQGGGDATVDGIPRRPERERAINSVAHRLVNDRELEPLWAWLREATVLTVLGANATDAELRTQEGMRALVALIEKRAIRHATAAKKETTPDA